jgi:hypothetical protein
LEKDIFTAAGRATLLIDEAEATPSGMVLT